mmetsp:Transcript_33799/g.100399  ORF Transcript_33799/g.100399 Transcript_33799/m.100399 type:complete len:446 (-) Transcript_33799:125-1462(-)
MMLPSPFLPRLYAEEYGVSMAVLFRMALLASVVDGIAAPAIGALSDRARRAGLSRGIFALAGSVPMALSVVLTFAPPAESLGSAERLATWCVVAVLGLHLSQTAVEVPIQALATEMTNNYDMRNRLVAAREGLGVFGSIAAAVLPSVLGFLGARQAMRIVAGGHAMFIMVSVAICFAATAGRGRDATPPPGKHKDGQFSTRRMIREVLLNKKDASARALLTSEAFGILGAGMNAASFPFFLPHVLLRAGQFNFDPAGLFLGMYILMSVLTLPLWVRMGEWLEKRDALSLAYMLQGGGFFMTFLLCGRGVDGRGGLIGFAIFGLMAGIGMAGTLIFPSAMRSDLCTQDEFRTRERREGKIEGLFGLVRRVFGTMGVVLVLQVLAASGFVEGHGVVQPLAARQAIRLVYGGIAGAMVLLAIIPLRWYSLTRAKQQEMVASMEARTAA